MEQAGKERDKARDEKKEITPGEGRGGFWEKIKVDSHKANMVAVAFVALIVGGLIGITINPTPALVPLSNSNCIAPDANSQVTAVSMSNAAVGQKVVAYLNENILEPQGVSARVTSVEDFDESIYLVNFNIMKGEEIVNNTSVYVTKTGGSMILGNVLDLDTPLPKPEPQPEVSYTQTEIPKTELFVMSFCPYGIEAERALAPVAKLLSGKAEIVPNYILYSPKIYAGREAQFCVGEYCAMHGIGELNEDVRQLCIYNYEKEKFWDYVLYIISKYDAGEWSASNIDSKWREAAEAAGIDVEKIAQCQADEAEQLLAKEKQLTESLGIGGSPTVLINGKDYSGARISESYKAAICSAFIEEPEECAKELSTQASTPTGSCG